MMIKKYLLWGMIQSVVDNLDNIDSYREKKCLENIVFKQDLDFNIKFVDKLLEKTKMM